MVFKPDSSRKGFTLIELLVVIAIIGILASVVMASLNSARAKSRDAKRQSDLKQLQLAIELYRDASGQYPTTDGWVLADSGPLNTNLVPTYISQLPEEPPGNAAAYYMYYLVSTNQYCLYAELEGLSTAHSSYTNAPYHPGGVGGYGMNYALCN